MPKRFQWLLLSVCVIALVLLLVAFWASLNTPPPDRVARTLLTAWQSQPQKPSVAGLWVLPPPADMPGYELSVGKLPSGHAVAILQKRRDWYGFHQERTYALVQSEATQAVWRLSQSRRLRVLDHTLWRRTYALTTITNAP